MLVCKQKANGGEHLSGFFWNGPSGPGNCVFILFHGDSRDRI